MSKEEIFVELNEVFQDVFDDEDICVDANTTADDIEDWDSLAQMNLVVAIEKHFKIRFKVEEIASLHNVGEMLKLIEQRVKG